MDSIVKEQAEDEVRWFEITDEALGAAAFAEKFEHPVIRDSDWTVWFGAVYAAVGHRERV